MQAMSEDERIDDLKKKIDDGFRQDGRKMDRGFAEMRVQIVSSERALRGEITDLRGELTAEILGPR